MVVVMAIGVSAAARVRSAAAVVQAVDGGGHAGDCSDALRIRLAMRRALPWIAIAAAFAVAALARYGLIEPEGYGFRCAAAGGPWWCAPREGLILAFHSRVIGWAAFALGVVAFVARQRAAALAAAVAGACGLVLYNYELSAVGFALGVLVLARRPGAASTGTA
jgi:hypothetical protein